MIVVDVHAEATSEKVALAHWLDGQVTAVLGTHTHVQTSDARVQRGGTAAITDVGMTGPHDSVIGVKADLAIHRMRTGMPVRFEVAEGGVRIEGALIDCDDVRPRYGDRAGSRRIPDEDDEQRDEDEVAERARAPTAAGRARARGPSSATGTRAASARGDREQHRRAQPARARRRAGRRARARSGTAARAPSRARRRRRARRRSSGRAPRLVAGPPQPDPDEHARSGRG